VTAGSRLKSTLEAFDSADFSALDLMNFGGPLLLPGCTTNHLVLSHASRNHLSTLPLDCARGT
jgi:hypothetical protein